MLRIVEKENSNIKQIEKLGINFAMVVTLSIVSYLRGDGKSSPINVSKCDPLDWGLLFILIIIGIILTAVGTSIVKRVFKIKSENSYKFTPGDLLFTD